MITKLEKSERKERPPLLYDLTSLQRDANSRFGFHAAPHPRRRPAALRRAHGAHLSAHQLALPAERHDPRDQADRAAGRRAQRVRARAPQYVLGLDVLPLGRVVNDAKVTDHHAIIPTRADREHGIPVDKMSDDDKRIYDLVVRRFLAVFHPEAVIENTRVETTVADHVFRTRGKRILVPGLARRVRRERRGGAEERSDDDEGREQQLPRLDQGEHRGGHRGGLRGEGDKAAAAIHRRLAR